MSKAEFIHPLMELGFTELEAEVYSALLQESPATGYRVAQVTGRLPGNVYKALESLQSKGAIIIDEGSSRMCRAVPPSELLSMLRRRYLEAESRAAKALEDLHEVSEDNRVYQIRSYDQVLERARTMLADAKVTVAADIFPGPVQELRAEFEAAAARGATVAVKSYTRGLSLDGVLVAYNPDGESVKDRFPRDWIILIVDGMEMLIASLGRESRSVHQAFWTRSATLAYMFHCATTSELALCALADRVAQPDVTLSEIKDAVEVFARSAAVDHTPPGDLPRTLMPYRSMYGVEVPGFHVLERGSTRSEAFEAAQDAREAAGKVIGRPSK
jgi:HTH-type transcriptional regulator, sugar sensing transcriptional regulator